MYGLLFLHIRVVAKVATFPSGSLVIDLILIAYTISASDHFFSSRMSTSTLLSGADFFALC